jgi:hypothetical protein
MATMVAPMRDSHLRVLVALHEDPSDPSSLCAVFLIKRARREPA